MYVVGTLVRGKPLVQSRHIHTPLHWQLANVMTNRWTLSPVFEIETTALVPI